MGCFHILKFNLSCLSHNNYYYCIMNNEIAGKALQNDCIAINKEKKEQRKERTKKSTSSQHFKMIALQ